MDKYQVCPTCQLRNAPNVPLCAYCGTRLGNAFDPTIPTTKAVPDAPTETKPEASGCANLLPQLATDSVGLLVKGMGKPLVLHQVTSLVLGRGDVPPGVSFVDLNEIGDMAMGVSRQHARLTHEDGRFWLEDMHSTNGSWLNQQRLSPGVPYLLSCQDIIWLGPVKLLVCLHRGSASPSPEPDSDFIPSLAVPSHSEPATPPSLKQVTLVLRAHPESALNVHPGSLAFLATHVLPYLQGIEGLQQVLETCQGKTAVAPHIHSLHTKDDALLLSISLVAEVMPLLQTLIAPWRKRHLTRFYGGNLTEAEGEALLVELGQQILQLVAPQIKQGAQAKHIYAMLPYLRDVATSALEPAPASKVRETVSWGKS